MGRNTRANSVLTDFVRDRLDQAVLPLAGQDRPESEVLTVVRPRPGLHREIPAQGPSDRRLPDQRRSDQSPPDPGLPDQRRPDHRRSDQGLPDQRRSDQGLPDQRRSDQGRSDPDQAELDETDEMPVRTPGLRLTFTRRHLTVVGIVLAMGILLAGYALTRARAVPVAAPVPMVAVQGSTPAAPPAGSATPVAPSMQIHVLGEVAQSGVHVLPAGARVADAIQAAGGLTPKARPGELNLAQELSDGQQLVIGGADRPSEIRGGDPGAAGGGGGTAGGGGSGTTGKVNLNTATSAQLDALPGVGPVTAEKIIAWRTQHGRFTRIEELQEVPGIGPKSFAEIAPHVTV